MCLATRNHQKLFKVEDEVENTERPTGNLEDKDGGRVFERGKGNWKYRKIEMPLFEGDPDEWILRSEKYFTVCHLNEDEKVEAAVVAMEGDALRWYQWENGRTPVVSWSEEFCTNFAP